MKKGRNVRKWLLQNIDQAKQFCCPISVLSDAKNSSKFEYMRYPVRLNLMDSESAGGVSEDDGEEEEGEYSDSDEEVEKVNQEKVFLEESELAKKYLEWFESTSERDLLYDKRRLFLFLIRQSERTYPFNLPTQNEKITSPIELLNILMLKKNPQDIHKLFTCFFLPSEVTKIRSFKGNPLRDFQVFVARPTLRKLVERKREMVHFCVFYHRNFEKKKYGKTFLKDEFVRSLFMEVFSMPRLSKMKVEKRIMFYRNCALVCAPTLAPPFGSSLGFEEIDAKKSSEEDEEESGEEEKLRTKLEDYKNPRIIFKYCFEELGNLFIWCKYYEIGLAIFDFLYFRLKVEKFEYVYNLFEAYRSIILPSLDINNSSGKIIPITLNGEVEDFDVTSIFLAVGELQRNYVFLKLNQKKKQLLISLIRKRLTKFYDSWKYEIDIEENENIKKHVKILLNQYISIESSDFIALIKDEDFVEEEFPTEPVTPGTVLKLINKNSTTTNKSSLDQKFIYLLYRLTEDSALIYRLLANFETVEIFVELRRELDRIKFEESKKTKEIIQLKKKISELKKKNFSKNRENTKEKELKNKYLSSNLQLSEKYEFVNNSYNCCMEIIRGENSLLKYLKPKNEFVIKSEEVDSWEERWRQSISKISGHFDPMNINSIHESYENLDNASLTFKKPYKKNTKINKKKLKLFKLQFSNDTEATMFQLEGTVNPQITSIIKALNILRVEMYNIGSSKLCSNILKVVPHIIELDLYMSEANDELFEFCENLEILEIDRCEKITGNGFKYLKNLKELKIQNNNAILNDSFELLPISLNQVCIKWMNKITINGINHLKSIKSLIIGMGIRIEQEELEEFVFNNRNCQIQFLKK